MRAFVTTDTRTYMWLRLECRLHTHTHTHARTHTLPHKQSDKTPEGFRSLEISLFFLSLCFLSHHRVGTCCSLILTILRIQWMYQLLIRKCILITTNPSRQLSKQELIDIRVEGLLVSELNMQVRSLSFNYFRQDWTCIGNTHFMTRGTHTIQVVSPCSPRKHQFPLFY